jgi:hypothetical protein
LQAVRVAGEFVRSALVARIQLDRSINRHAIPMCDGYTRRERLSQAGHNLRDDVPPLAGFPELLDQKRQKSSPCLKGIWPHVVSMGVANFIKNGRHFVVEPSLGNSVQLSPKQLKTLHRVYSIHCALGRQMYVKLFKQSETLIYDRLSLTQSNRSDRLQEFF